MAIATKSRSANFDTLSDEWRPDSTSTITTLQVSGKVLRQTLYSYQRQDTISQIRYSDTSSAHYVFNRPLGGHILKYTVSNYYDSAAMRRLSRYRYFHNGMSLPYQQFYLLTYYRSTGQDSLYQAFEYDSATGWYVYARQMTQFATQSGQPDTILQYSAQTVLDSLLPAYRYLQREYDSAQFGIYTFEYQRADGQGNFIPNRYLRSLSTMGYSSQENYAATAGIYQPLDRLAAYNSDSAINNISTTTTYHESYNSTSGTWDSTRITRYVMTANQGYTEITTYRQGTGWCCADGTGVTYFYNADSTFHRYLSSHLYAYHSYFIPTYKTDYETYFTTVRTKSESNLNIWPNPINRKVTLRLPEGISSGSVEILGIQGKIYSSRFITSQDASLDLDAIPNGLYLVRFIGGGRILTARLVKAD